MMGTDKDAEALRFEPTPENFLMPLDFIEAEHARQNRVRESFELGDAEIGLGDLAARAPDLLHFLKVDLALHHADEEEDLYPLLTSRAKEDERLQRSPSQLAKEHELDEDLIDFVCADLEKLAGGLSLANPTRFVMNLAALFDSQRRHLESENKTILPLARQWLSAEDLAGLGRRMARRRGVTLSD